MVVDDVSLASLKWRGFGKFLVRPDHPTNAMVRIFSMDKRRILVIAGSDSSGGAYGAQIPGLITMTNVVQSAGWKLTKKSLRCMDAMQ